MAECETCKVLLKALDSIVDVPADDAGNRFITPEQMTIVHEAVSQAVNNAE